jgi:transcriptional regulator with XRE-family HTH domain
MAALEGGEIEKGDFLMPTADRPYAGTRAQVFIEDKINSSGKSQRAIANEAGFRLPNMLSMIKGGDSKLPLDRVATLARALGVDETHLLRLALEQNYRSPEMEKLFDRLFSRLNTSNEQMWVDLIREVVGKKVPPPNEAMKNAVREALASWYASNAEA